MARRRLLLLSVSLVSLVTLASCRSRVDLSVEVRPDGSGEVVLATGLDEDGRSLLAARGLDPGGPADLGRTGATAPPGAREEPWREGDFEGRRYVTPFDRLGELEGFFNAPGEPPVVEARREGGELTLTVDLPALTEAMGAGTLARPGPAPAGGSGGEGAPLPSPEDLARHADIRFTVRMPGRVLDHNADTEDGGVLVWKLLPFPTRPARATADLDAATRPDRVPVPWLAGGGALGAAGLAAGWHHRRRSARRVGRWTSAR